MRETAPSIVIAGGGAITAAGSGIDSLRQAVAANRGALRVSERFNGPRFQSNVVGEIAQLGEDLHHNGGGDPAWSLATRALRQAQAEAAHLLNQCDPKRIGLVLSTTKANIAALEALM